MAHDYLLFRLYGPLASWGDVAVGEMRGTFTHPTRSAVFGLLAAALGIRRDQQDRLTALSESLSFAVRLEAAGDLLRDYHTAQVPDHKDARHRASRRDELDYTTLTTILSTRDYRTDTLATVCLRLRSKDAAVSLQDIAQALEHPEFVLYLGRKSCPLAVPMEPHLLHAPDLASAFTLASFKSDALLDALDWAPVAQVFWEDEDASLEALHATQRWDDSINRARWQFQPRLERRGIIPHDPKEV